MRKLILIVFGFTFILSGCVYNPTANRTQDNLYKSKKHAPIANKYPKSIKGNRVVVDLINKAKKQSASGDNETASTTIERAIRIEPTNPAVWHNLAIVKYRSGDYSGAETTALKSNSLVSNKHHLKTKNWELISAARKAKGDSSGAKRALQKANSLK